MNLKVYSWMKQLIILTVLFQACDIHAGSPRLLQTLTNEPTNTPSLNPSRRPSLRPTKKPTNFPTENPSESPSFHPSMKPSLRPTLKESHQPSSIPSFRPSGKPSERPTSSPSTKPSFKPTSIPSSQPSATISSQPSISQKPSPSPSVSPTSHPTSKPSTLPSNDPSPSPSVSRIPSPTPTTSAKPSHVPTQTPSLTNSFEPSLTPSAIPTFQPSLSHSPTARPSSRPSFQPSISQAPSSMPSSQPSLHPSYTPSIRPTDEPSNSPSLSMQPSLLPSASVMPTSPPSSEPSCQPTNFALSETKGTYYQEFNTTSNVNATQSEAFESLIESYTKLLTDGIQQNDRINTTCDIEDKTFIAPQQKLNMRYVVHFQSIHSNVTSYEVLLENYINNNLSKMANDLRNIGIDVFEAKKIFLLELTDPPTATPTAFPSLQPSIRPSLAPSGHPSPQPSESPTFAFSENPSDFPSSPPSLFSSSIPSYYPSSKPSAIPTSNPTRSPTFTPTNAPTVRIRSSGTIIATVSAAIGGIAVIFAAGLCVRSRCYKPDDRNTPMMIVVGEDQDRQPSRTNGILGGGLRSPIRIGNQSTDQYQFQRTPNATDQELDNLGIPVPPSAESMISHESIISTGSSVDGASENDFNDIQVLDDEFEKYKDQNLEQMRSKLEGIVPNFDGMMCQALTMALMEDDDEVSESESLVAGEKDSIQIEVDLYCEINDWLKRSQGASIDERREFMQESLNKMVANVRHGIISHEDATRAIHGSAALLGLQLAADIPETTLIVTGMRKSVSREEVEEAFKKFGEIECTAISSNRRGFGIVRFTSTKYAHRALERFRIGEIVVDDVAVSVRLLKADMPEIEVRRVYSNERRSR